MLLDAETLKQSAVLDPTIAELIKTTPIPVLPWDNNDQLKVMAKVMDATVLSALGTAEPALQESYFEIAMRDGFQSRAKLIKPTSPPACGSPLIVLMFGGGFVIGSPDQMTPVGRAFARQFDATVVCVGYRLAPDYKFPTSQTDCFDGLKWVAANAESLGADPSKGFVVGGVSAGGNTAAVSVRLAQEDKLAHPITGCWLNIPSVLAEHCVPEKYKQYWQASEQNANAPILDKAGTEAIKKVTQWDENSPLRYPILFKSPLGEHPPTYFQACGMDPLRDDALIYEELLKEAGVKTKIDFYPGAPHGHSSFFPDLEISKRAKADTMIGMGWLLGKSVTAEEGLKALAGPNAVGGLGA
ncbi:lipase/esterase [Acrodontium crateriforme]|uniref:Lipase/esterase n=1 Tax=Acrodontium crateriforme TaxID=150365 RepID=A0AAQ3R707_9PEZI|nr:lipase/esterase [Acrodontium crateriforme]